MSSLRAAMLRRFRPDRWSLPLVVALGLAVATFTLLSVSAAFAIDRYQRFETRQELGHAALMADQISASLALPLWNLDSAQTKASMALLTRQEEVSAVILRGPDGVERVRVAGRARGDSMLTVERRRIVHAGTALGEIEVRLGAAPLLNRIESIRNRTVAIVVVLATVLASSLYALLWWTVLLPLRRMEEAAKSVRESSTIPGTLRSRRFFGELETLRISAIDTIDLLDRRLVEQREEARRLLESELRFRLLVDTIPDLIWLKDGDGLYLACNRMFERLFGATEEEIRGKRDHDFVDRDLADFFRAKDLEAIAAGRSVSNEETVVFADDGHVALLETTKTPMFDADGNLVGVLGVGRDITHRRESEEERRRLDEKLAGIQKLEALAGLVAGTAHNINNVLGAILGTASLHAHDGLSESDREAFQTIEKASRRGADVVRSLVRFASPHLRKSAPFEIHQLLAELRPLLHGTLRDRARLVEDLCEDELWVLGDASDISHAFMNVFLNALDALPEGGGTIRVRTACDPNAVRVSFEDDGSGMTPEVLARVLEPFYTTKEVGKGTGLGLSMTHGVVKAHGGSLEILSERGEGTRVVFRLPRVPAPALVPPPPEPIGSGGLRVLLVDDDVDLRDLSARLLRRGGHEVLAVENGKAAIALVEAGEPLDAVVLDQNMPGMTGVQVFERLRRLRPELPVLVSSGQPDIDGLSGFQGGRVAFVPKPCGADDLLIALRKLLDPEA
jgi:PAS domain S-box-containing protein